MMQDGINNEYFEWLFDMVCGERFSSCISYRKLLTYLHSTVFSYSIPNDANRADDGISLRYRFLNERDYDTDYIDDLGGSCTMFEMVTALALRCEETLMDDPTIGNRTSQWFWSMIVNLGLGDMYDENYDEEYVDEVVTRFLRRDYDPDGNGGLFTIRNCRKDLRKAAIWHQFNWYLDRFV